jgi:KDO2-lipid IV(A) lauroyltransferase
MKRISKKLKWRCEYGLVYLLFSSLRLVPSRWRTAWGRGLGVAVWHLLRIRRQVVLANLRQSFAGQLGEARIQAIAREFYANLGVTLLEFIAFYDDDPRVIPRLVTVEGLEHLAACQAKGSGAIITSGHFGNWELAGAALAAHGYPMSYIVKSQSNPHIDRLQNEVRRRAGIGIIRQGASVRQLVYALRRGEFVGMLADQDGGDGGVFIDFLGRMASVFRGPAYWAYRLGCPILPAAILRQADGRHKLVIEAPLVVDPAWDEETAIYELTRLYTARLEQFIRKRPELYFWVHRRWKTRPPHEKE